jgi:hypothetical protein
MGAKQEFRDVVEFPYPNPDDPRLLRVHKKGFKKELEGMSEEEILEYARLFPAWCDAKLRKCPVVEFEDGVVAVLTPRLRVFRPDYYKWIEELELPRLYYRFITLTLYRELGIIYSWAKINRWISACLNRVRVKLRRDYGLDVFYLWVVEIHSDGFPHVHVVFGLPRYVPELTFGVLLRIFQEAWVDEKGRPLCASHGIDIRYVGRNVEKVRRYVLKYLVDEHGAVWNWEVRDGVVRVRLSTMLIWLFRVRLFGVSQKLRRPERAKVANVVFHGRVALRSVYVRVGYDMPYEEFKRGFLRRGILKFENKYLPVLVPSVVRRGVDADPDEDDLYRELIERF